MGNCIVSPKCWKTLNFRSISMKAEALQLLQSLSYVRVNGLSLILLQVFALLSIMWFNAAYNTEHNRIVCLLYFHC